MHHDRMIIFQRCHLGDVIHHMGEDFSHHNMICLSAAASCLLYMSTLFGLCHTPTVFSKCVRPIEAHCG